MPALIIGVVFQLDPVKLKAYMCSGLVSEFDDAIRVLEKYPTPFRYILPYDPA